MLDQSVVGKPEAGDHDEAEQEGSELAHVVRQHRGEVHAPRPRAQNLDEGKDKQGDGDCDHGVDEGDQAVESSIGAHSRRLGAEGASETRRGRAEGHRWLSEPWPHERRGLGWTSGPGPR
jgi:hypothetical protein